MRGLSQRALAKATDGKLSHNAIAKYEKAEMAPGSSALVALSKALDQPLDYFVRDIEPLIQKVRHRKVDSKVSKNVADGLALKAQSFFERYWEIEEILGTHIPYKPPIEVSEISDVSHVAELAGKLRDAWSLGRDPLPNIHQLMEAKGIKVHELETDERGFDGFSAWSSKSEPLVVVASWLNTDIPRKRMTETHELAHIVLNLSDEISEKEEEKIVWGFAGELMMPEEEFRDLFGQRTKISIAELLELRKHFGVSMMAIVYRAGKLGLLPDNAVKNFFIFANKSGWRKNGEPNQKPFRGSESSSRFRKLVLRATVEEKISFSKGASLLQMPLDEFRNLLSGETFE